MLARGFSSRLLPPSVKNRERKAQAQAQARFTHPLVPGLPKLQIPRRPILHPRFLAHIIRKVAPSDRHIQNEVEVLVKRRGVPARLCPRIVKVRSVGGGGGEVAAAPEGLVEGRVEDLV